MAKKKINNNQQGRHSHITSDKSWSYAEVSFDVLENAVEKNQSIKSLMPDYDGRAIISSDEVLFPEKKARYLKHQSITMNLHKASRLGMVVVFLILLFALLAGCVMYLINNGYVIKPKDYSPLKEKIIEISTYDDEIIKLNQFLDGSINDAKVSQFDIDKEDYEKVKSDLRDISEDIANLKFDYDKQSNEYLNAGYAQQTIESRILMIDAGLKIYDYAVNNINIIRDTEDFWNDVLTADTYLKESDNLVQSNDPANYIAALDVSRMAEKLLIDAKNKIQALSVSTKNFDFANYINYIDLRLESARLSCSASEAMIAQDIDSITSYNTAYIETSNRASDIALKMSTTPTQVIRTNYDISTRPLIEEFRASRKNAADYDFALRNFLNE